MNLLDIALGSWGLDADVEALPPYEPDFEAWVSKMSLVARGVFLPSLETVNSQDPITTKSLRMEVETLGELFRILALRSSGAPVFKPTTDLCLMLLATAPVLNPDPPVSDGFVIELPPRLFPISIDQPRKIICTRDDRDGKPRIEVQLLCERGTQKTVIDSRFAFIACDGGPEVYGTVDSLGPMTPEARSLLLTANHIAESLSNFISARTEPLECENEHARQRDRNHGKQPRQKVYTVGSTIKLQPELRSVLRSRFSAGGTGPLWKLQHRYCVLGHWRWQPVGRRLPEGHEGPLERKLIWIRPFWKGPEGAEAWQHTYEVALAGGES